MKSDWSTGLLGWRSGGGGVGGGVGKSQLKAINLSGLAHKTGLGSNRGSKRVSHPPPNSRICSP